MKAGVLRDHPHLLLLAASVLLIVGSAACLPPPGQQPSAQRDRAQSTSTPGAVGSAPTATPDSGLHPSSRRVRVPILEYHYIRVNPNPRDRLGFRLSVTPGDFAAQMHLLAADGFQPVTVADLRAALTEQFALPPNPVVLTFDDGYQDFFQAAFPVLETYHLRSVSYVIPGFLGRVGYMTQAQVADLDQTGLVEIASHTMTHPDLTRLDARALAIQLDASKATLEQLLGHPVDDFCYPYGRFDPRIVAAVAAAGYQSATTEVFGTDHGWSDRLTWSRVRVTGGEPLTQFSQSLFGPSRSPAV